MKTLTTYTLPQAYKDTYDNINGSINEESTLPYTYE